MFDKLSISSKTEKILTKALDEQITVEEANHLMGLKGAEIHPLLATADYLRQEIVGDYVTFINNCNINFTNICKVRCGFCAFGRDADDADAYILNDEQILEKAQGAVEKGAREFTLMGGVLPDADIDYYEHLLCLLKGEYPDVMIHGFSPTMIRDACLVSGTRINAPRGVIPYFVLKYGFSIPLATVTLIILCPSICSSAISNSPIAEGEILCLMRSFNLSIQSSTSFTPTIDPSLSIPI